MLQCTYIRFRQLFYILSDCHIITCYFILCYYRLCLKHGQILQYKPEDSSKKTKILNIS